MKICAPIPEMRQLIWQQSASITGLVALAEQLLPRQMDHELYTMCVLTMVHMEHLGVETSDDITQHTTSGVTLDHLRFIEECRRFYYVEHDFPDLVALHLRDVSLSGTTLVAQRNGYMIIDQG